MKGHPSSEDDFLVHWPENPVSYLKLTEADNCILSFLRIKSDNLNVFFFSFQSNSYSLQTEEKPQLTKRQNTAIQNSSLKATFKTLYIFLSKMRGYYIHCFVTHLFSLPILRVFFLFFFVFFLLYCFFCYFFFCYFSVILHNTSLYRCIMIYVTNLLLWAMLYWTSNN